MLYPPTATIMLLCFSVSASALAASSASASTPATDPTSYQSPYSVQFTVPVEELTSDLLGGERGDPKEQSTIPYDLWYSAGTQRRYGAWGPPARVFEPPAGIQDRPAQWRRERVIAVGLHYVGYSYQHHHLPDWDPPATWPWLKVGRGYNGRGVDCSNFTEFVYNLALGVKLNGAIGIQAAQTALTVNGRRITIESLEKPKSYAACVEQLKTGDLLYIYNNVHQISHVVLWIGNIAYSPDGVPLVLDCTGVGHTDCNGQSIPDGVYLRPFRQNSWYYENLSHIHRIIPAWAVGSSSETTVGYRTNRVTPGVKAVPAQVRIDRFHSQPKMVCGR